VRPRPRPNYSGCVTRLERERAYRRYQDELHEWTADRIQAAAERTCGRTIVVRTGSFVGDSTCPICNEPLAHHKRQDSDLCPKGRAFIVDALALHDLDSVMPRFDFTDPCM
jgi:hypothetical protein